MLIPIILSSDKTTVSVATGHNEYWPIYLSIGNIHNNAHQAHRNGVVLLGFLPIPKGKHEASGSIYCHIYLHLGTKQDMNDAEFRHCRCQIFHSAIARMLQSLKTAMAEPEIVQCPDHHFCRAIYSLGPYIGDYPEQALLSCVVQGWCAK